jgi:hypothetical protein
MPQRLTGRLLALLAATAALSGCGEESGTDVGLPAVSTESSGTTIELPEVVRCQPGSAQFVVERPPEGSRAKITGDEANALLDAPAASAAPTTIDLVLVTIPGTLGNAPPDPDARYEPGTSQNPGRTERRLAWQITKEAPEGSLMPMFPPEGVNVVLDPATCTVRQWVTFVDANSRWPLGTFPLTSATG